MSPERMQQDVPRYFRAWVEADRAVMEEAVGDPFTFTSPYDDHLDRSGFFDRCWAIGAGLFESFDIRRLVPDGQDGAFVLYEARLRRGGVIRNAEHLRFAGDRLRSVEVFFGLAPGAAPTSPAEWDAARERARAR